MSEIVERNHGPVRVLRLNRPDKRNALKVGTFAELHRRLDAAAADPGVRCLVLTGTGASFCAGADVEEWAEAEARGELETYGWTDAAHRFVHALAAFPKPTVAALNGSAVGAGVDLALACDFRVAAASASLRCGYTGMAYNPDMGSTWFLPRLIGAERAKRFVFLNEKLGAADAAAWGLVGEVVEAERLEEMALAFAARLAAGPTVALAHAKRLIDSAGERVLEAQLALERAAGEDCGRTRDAREALEAAQARRAPVFEGR